MAPAGTRLAGRQAALYFHRVDGELLVFAGLWNPLIASTDHA
jgi:putative SOS response-associated peptidase YedK